MIRSVRIEHFSEKVLISLSKEVIFALAALSSLFRSSFSIASLDTGTEFFFFFLGGGCEAGTNVESGTKIGAGVEDNIGKLDGMGAAVV